MVQPVRRLHGEGIVPPDGGAAQAGAGVIAALHQRAVHRPVEGQAVVVALLHQAGEVLHRHGGVIRIEHRPDLPFAGVEDGDGVALVRGLKLLFLAFHRRAVDLCRFFAAAGSGGQRQSQGQNGRSGRDSSAHKQFLSGRGARVRCAPASLYVWGIDIFSIAHSKEKWGALRKVLPTFP